MYTFEMKKSKTFQVILTTKFCIFNGYLVYEEVFSSDDEDEDENSKWFSSLEPEPQPHPWNYRYITDFSRWPLR